MFYSHFSLLVYETNWYFIWEDISSNLSLYGPVFDLAMLTTQFICHTLLYSLFPLWSKGWNIYGMNHLPKDYQNRNLFMKKKLKKFVNWCFLVMGSWYDHLWILSTDCSPRSTAAVGLKQPTGSEALICVWPWRKPERDAIIWCMVVHCTNQWQIGPGDPKCTPKKMDKKPQLAVWMIVSVCTLISGIRALIRKDNKRKDN